MARKRYKPEEIVAKLRQVDVLVSQGQTMVDAIRQIRVSEVTYYRWRQEFGGLKTEQVKRLKDLELENSRLRRKYRMLNVLDEFTHECLAIRVARKLKAIDVIDVLSDLFILRGVPAQIRSDNGPEFVAKAVREWIAAVGAKTAYIERGRELRAAACPYAVGVGVRSRKTLRAANGGGLIGPDFRAYFAGLLIAASNRLI